MKFSFIMIVLNGMPFIKHSLRSIYDFADEIIVIEGPVEKLKIVIKAEISYRMMVQLNF